LGGVKTALTFKGNIMFNPETATEEEIKEESERQQKEVSEQEATQASNRAKASRAKPKKSFKGRGIKGKGQIVVIAVRKIGLDDGETSEAGEEISIPKDVAIRLQDNGAIKIKL
jgi:hypothetical protein